MSTMAWVLPALLLLYRLMLDFVPMFPLNDVHRKTLMQKKKDILRHEAPLAIAVLLGLVGAAWSTAVSLLIGLLYAAALIFIWWLPYVSGGSEAGKQQWEHYYGRTHRFLPRNGDHVVPDTAHVVLSALVLVWIAAGMWQLLTPSHEAKSVPASTAAQSPHTSGTTPAGTLKPAAMQVAFTQAGQNPASVLIDAFGKAQTSLDIAINAVNHPDIVDAILQARIRGVNVRVITDRSEAGNAAQAAQIARLKEGGIPVKVNARKGIMNLKVALIDGKTSASGSFNYTLNAASVNDEVLFLVQDEASGVAIQKEFEQMWNDADRFKAWSGDH